MPNPEFSFFLEDTDLGMEDLWPTTFYDAELVSSFGQCDSDGVGLSKSKRLQPILSAETEIYPVDYGQDAYNYLKITPSTVIRELADLNVALHECSANLPSMPRAAMSGTGIASYGHRPPKNQLFAIDELFRLTSKFIDTIKVLPFGTGGTSSSTDQKLQFWPALESAQQPQYSNPSEIRAIALSESLSHVDEATLLLIMSCHSRLTDTFLSIFQMIRACIEHSAVPLMDEDAVVLLPRLHWGSLTAPQVIVSAKTRLEPSTTRMYMFLVTSLSSQLHENLAEVLDTGGKFSIRSGSAFQIFFATTVKERNDRFGQAIEVTKKLL